MLLNLEESGSFKTTHTIISELRKVDNWTLGEIDWLIDIALSNNQVGHILKDNDVSRFYKSLIEDRNSEKASKLNKILDEK